jgi:putative DNA primase/helicase
MIDVERLPEAILNAPAVVWKWVDDGFDKEGKPKRTKPPFRAVAPNDLASTTDPTTWSTFAEAVDTYLDGKADGVGIVFCNGMAGVDLDHCRDPETGTIEDWAWKIIRKLDSYTEVSPSGTGIHILVYGALPEGRKKDGARGIEMYDSERGRYFTVTCQHLEGTKVTVKNRQAELAALHAEVFGKNGGRPEPPRREASPAPNMADAELLERARRARDGAKFSALWYGDRSGYASHSEADQALCNLLAFWTGADAARMNRLFRQSGLYREKWDRDDYSERTIASAITNCRETYSGTKRAEVGGDIPEKQAVEMHTGNGADDTGAWSHLQDIDDALKEELPEPKALYPRLVFAGCLTGIYSPHGIGKTLILHAVAMALANADYRVCLIDRDNPAGLFKKRLREWRKGWTGNGRIAVLDRRNAPPLAGRGSDEWLYFPSEQFDVLLIDAQDSFLEGTNEKDTDKQGMAIAILLHLSHAKGLAVVMLGNTIKSGEYARGSGAIGDRADVNYEVRDARGFTPSGKKPWVLELPPGGAGAWAIKASASGNPRLAFACEKDRVGALVEPFILEVDVMGNPWTLRDVTSEVESAASEAVKSKDDQEAHALDELAKQIEQNGAINKKEAEGWLMTKGVSRDRARWLSKENSGKRWVVEDGGKGKPSWLHPLSYVPAARLAFSTGAAN